MDPGSKRRWTYVATAIVAAIIIIAAIILMQQPIQNKTTPPPAKVAPVVTTGSATGIGQTTATLNGNLAILGTATTVTVGFLYGTGSNLTGATNITVASQTAAAGFNHELSGLTAGTGYSFQTWALGDGFIAGSVVSFKTLASSTPPTSGPSVSTGAATRIGTSAATLNGDLSGLGTATTVTVGFLYGTSPALTGAVNASTAQQTATGSFGQSVSGLQPNTTYYAQAWALGDGFTNGSIVSFRTSAGPGNGNVVPPGWAHAACPDVPARAPAHGVRTRCLYNETYGEWKKQHDSDASQAPPPSTQGLLVQTTAPDRFGSQASSYSNE